MSDQIILPPAELRRLQSRIEDDWNAAISDHDERMERFREYYQRWRVRYDAPDEAEPDKSNFRVPLLKWHVTAKLSKEVEGLLGNDTEIRAEAVGPSDGRRAKKVARFMNWRVFNSMDFVNPFVTFALRKILFGRSVAYSPWRRDTYEIPLRGRIRQMLHRLSGGRIGESGTAVDYEGPGFEPLWPDDFVVPAEEVTDLHGFTFVFRRFNETSGGFFEGLADGLYQDNSEPHEDLQQLFLNATAEGYRDAENTQVKDENDEGEGVTKRDGASIREGLPIREWYGKWRMLRNGVEDAEELDLKQRELVETELVVRYSNDLSRIVGIQDLAEQYPLTPRRRPFVEAAMPGDGYWPPGFGEILGEIEAEITQTSNLGVEAGQFSVGPLIFYRPGVGIDAERTRYEPASLVPTDDPSGVRVVTFTADLRFINEYINFLMGLAERLGVSDLNTGRQSDKPQAPKTVGQTVALLDEANVRFALDNRVFREDLTKIFKHFWELEIMFLPPRQFFRVTEEQAEGLFPVRDGGAHLEPRDKVGDFDFKLKLATSAHNKEVDRQRAMQLFSLDIQNPIVVANPVSLWKVTNRLHKAMGDENFEDVIPRPPEADRSKRPEEELTLLMQGEAVTVSSLDNDHLHVAQHKKDIEWLMAQEPPDKLTAQKLLEHIPAHLQQIQQKAFMQRLAQKTAENVDEMLKQGVSPTELLSGGAQNSQAGAGGQGGAGGAA